MPKTVNKKSKKKVDERRNFFVNKDNYLYYIFFVLLIVVVILTIMVFNKSRENLSEESNLVIPIVNKGINNVLSLDVLSLAKEDEYTIKIINHKDGKVNKDVIKYSITIENESDARIKVTKDDQQNNLIVDQEATIIEDVFLGKEKEDYDIYHFSVIDKSKAKENDKINIKIAS